MKRIWVAVILSMMLVCIYAAAAADAPMSVSMPETTTEYRTNHIVVRCPWDGTLFCRIFTDEGKLIYELPAVEVSTGEHSIAWDGLGAWDEPIPKGSYFVRCTLKQADREISDEAFFEIGKPAQAVVFALPSCEVINPDGNQWYMEYKMVRPGRMVIEIWQDGLTDAPLQTIRKQVTDAKPMTWKWQGSINGKAAADGRYTLRIYAEENPDYVQEIHVTIDRSHSQPIVDLTGSVFPENEDELNACSVAPAVVSTVRNGTPMKIYLQKDTRSMVLGTVYGQTQCLEVHSIDGDWAEVTAYRQEDGAPVRGFCRTDKLKAVEVNREYLLVVNRNDSTMTVWHDGAAIGRVPVTLGSAAPRHAERETISGSFIAGERATSVSLKEGKFSYAIHINESCTIYQADASVHEGTTRGGIAAAGGTKEQTLTAYWLWTHIPPNTRVIIMDDPESRLLRVACADAGTMPDASAWHVYEPVEMKNGETEVILTFGGDVVLGTREKWMNDEQAFPAYLKQYGLAYPLEGMKGIFAKDDMTVVNLEGVLKADGKGENKDRLYRFRGLPEWVEALSWGSVEQVNVANNHHNDYGKAGIESTIAALEAAGVPYSGYGATYIAEFNGHKIGFGGCRETTWMKNNQDIAAEIAYLRDNGCEVVIYTCHWGTEYDPAHNETQQAMAQAIVDAGADIIIGHHPHIVQGIDVIDGVPVLYSLGNLMFGGTHEMKTFDAAVARVHLRFNEEGYCGASITMIPVLTSSSAEAWINDFHPVPAQGEDALRILAKIQADSSIKVHADMFFPAK